MAQHEYEGKPMMINGWDVQNYGIYTIHSSGLKGTDIPFNGILPDAKKKARKVLGEQEGEGWAVKVVTDCRVIYSESQSL